MTMRKAMIVFFAAIILVSACFMSLHCVFLGVSDDVTVTRQTLYGDSSVADGVNILVRNQYQQNLMWETSLTLGSNPVPETEFTFSNEQIRIPDEIEQTGIEFNILRDPFQFIHIDRIPESAKEKYAALMDAVTGAIDAVPAGENKTFTINFSAYLDYYPLDGQVILGDLTTVFSEFEYWTDDSEEIALAINEFFRIPVDGEYTVEYTIDKTSGGSAYGAQMKTDFYLNASGVATDDACYFTFNTVREDGTVVDTSLIPGGYGIYRLPYDENGLNFDALEMVYALDPTERYDSMYLSDDGKRIRLQTWQGDNLMLTVIDLAGMTQIQKVKLLTESEEWHYDVIDYDDFTLIVENRRNSDSMDQITVWEELSDGTFTNAFTANMNMDVFPEKSNLNLFDSLSNAVDYRNGKLVVIKNRLIRQEPYWYKDYCDIYVIVYDATGMIYAGTCEWNLTHVNSLYPNTERVKPTSSGALEVSW